MSIREKEDELFARWEKERPKYEFFVKDGVADESAYQKDKIKTAFVLKEYPHESPGHDLREQELTCYAYPIWIIVAKTLHEIRKLSGDAQGELNEDMPKSICALNLGKNGGAKSTDDMLLALIAMDDREFIKEQLAFYCPRLIICCGTFNTFRYVTRDQYQEVDETNVKFFWYKNAFDNYVVSTNHPSCRRWGNAYTEELIEVIKKIDGGALLRT